jgi:hypothetical protein
MSTIRTLLFLSITAIFAACSKQDDPRQNYTVSGPYSNIAEVLSTHAPKPLTTSISVTAGGSAHAQGGTRVVIPPNSFVDAGGQAITGAVDVTVTDWLRRGDMIYGNVLPISNGMALESGGQMRLAISQNGKPVRVRSGRLLEVRLPQFGAPAPGMELFLGQPAQGAGNQVTWTQADSGRIVYGTDTLSFFTDTVGYANADRFLTNPNYQTFTVDLRSDDTGSYKNMTMVALYQQYRALWPLNVTAEPGRYREDHIPDVPVHLVAYGVRNGYFYGGHVTVTPRTGNSYVVKVQQTDPLAFKKLLNGL